jgi:hypothetical protein
LKKYAGDKNPLVFSGPVVVDKSIWFASRDTNVAVEFNMETCKSIVHVVGEKEYGFDEICFDGEYFWLWSRCGSSVIKWNAEKGILREFPEICLDGKNVRSNFVAAIYKAGYIWFLPAFAGHAYKIDVHTDVASIAEEFEIDPHIKGSNQLTAKYSFAHAYGDDIYAYNECRRTLIQYNPVTKERREEAIRYSPQVTEGLETIICNQFSIDPGTMSKLIDCYYLENSTAPLVNYIDYIVRNDSGETALRNRRKEIMQSANANVDGTAGQVILDYVKNFVK